MSELRIEYHNPNELKPYENNARDHKEEDIEAIRESIREFGFNDPIGIWSDENLIVEGHGRQMAAIAEGLDSVPCIRLDHLTDEQRRAYALAHNKTAELSMWNLEMLDFELGGITEIDMSVFGFDNKDPDEVVEDDFEVVVPEEPKAKLGDVYKLGAHRLMCGDSTNLTHVERLLDRTEADLVVTDPPYNMSYEGAGRSKNRERNRIMNDSMPAADFKEFLLSVFGNYYSVMKNGASIYCFYKELGEGVFLTALKESGIKFKQELVWVKNQLVLGGAKYQNMYEPCLFGCKGKVGTWNGKRKQRSVIEGVDLMTTEDLKEAVRSLTELDETDVLRERKPLANDLHPTMKPVRLIDRLIQNSSNKGDVVLDLFGGSGSTIIACEQNGRGGYAMELDPRFVDVIINRWEAFTGRKAEQIGGN